MLRERRASFPGLTRPELAIIAAYSKMSLQQRLAEAEWIGDPFLERYLLGYFPKSIGERFGKGVQAHRLRTSIVALELTNAVINRMGAGFALRILRDTRRDPTRGVVAWCVVITLSEADRIFDQIAFAPIDTALRNELLLRWEVSVESAVKLLLATGGRGTLGEQMLARSIIGLSSLRRLLEITRVVRSSASDPAQAASAWDRVGEIGGFSALEEILESLETDDRLERQATEGLREDLSEIRRRLTVTALRRPADELDGAESGFSAVRALAENLRSAKRASVAGVFVIVRELWRLAETG
jgi:NAD-specific glutamate dehydrogenase